MAGLYCKLDHERGVWAAPANKPLQGGVHPIYSITDSQQAKHASINMIREFPRVGSLPWGARTLDPNSDMFRYISVRRLFDAVARYIRSTLQTVLSAPNEPPTWEYVRTAIDTYLSEIWQKGGLQGASAQDGYFVQIGSGITMSSEDVSRGLIRVKVGLAAIRPAEFIILVASQLQE
ncbi:hypothetical protein N7517_009373 [Penicillium concentricum]|uniref:Tail sheath protein C-terminal domain-containing protein n=1 Tax=Penicillium concentricum TaxID=293559 RepID=A0A9W9RHI4_9EURO|nr:uncharacterized protein N7517_009373 [Penicillium concentricum]KAJ5360182.1 hypothetical protein N7517_009373 [Penicillium concentricum]